MTPEVEVEVVVLHFMASSDKAKVHPLKKIITSKVYRLPRKIGRVLVCERESDWMNVCLETGLNLLGFFFFLI